MLTKNKLAIIVAALLSVASSVVAAQAQTAVDLNGGFPTDTGPDRTSNPYPGGHFSHYTGHRSSYNNEQWR
ncbi:MAG: hypothetical protein ACLPKB_00895 [Xanthobacteraceae bacterium]